MALHVRIRDRSSSQLADSAQQEKVKAAERASLGDSGLELFKDRVLDDGVGYQNQGGHNSLPEGLEAALLDHLCSSLNCA